MKITKGTSIFETIDSLVAAKLFFNKEDDDYPILMVEGKDDVNVIQRYYYHNRKGKVPFKIVLAEDLNQKNNGKKNALNAYQKYKKHFSKIFCLLDKDYDLLLGEDLSATDSNISYYDYYELENYLFEEPILRLFFDRYFECTDNSDFYALRKELEEAAEIYHPFSKASIFRELFYREMTNEKLDEEEIKHIANATKKSPQSILENNSPVFSNYSLKEKVEKYFEIEFSEVDLSFKDLEKDTNSLQESAADIEDVDPLDFFKYNISASYILQSLLIVLRSFKTLQFNSIGTNLSLEKSLKQEWIPIHSTKFEKKLSEIEKKI